MGPDWPGSTTKAPTVLNLLLDHVDDRECVRHLPGEEMAADALWEDEPASQVLQVLKTSFVCLSRVGTKLCRAAALQNRV